MSYSIYPYCKPLLLKLVFSTLSILRCSVAISAMFRWAFRAVAHCQSLGQHDCAKAQERGWIISEFMLEGLDSRRGPCSRVDLG